jgi:iron(III) transport system substrate-binding protein
MPRRNSIPSYVLSVQPQMRLAILALVILTISGCSRQSPKPDAGEVVLYSSVDDVLLREIVTGFENETGIKVRLVGDNEANKTTGLVQRLVMEKDRPSADVWWSSEPFGTIRLEREGVLQPYRSQAGEDSIEGGWPEHLKGNTWYGFALRARVIVYATGRVDSPPETIVDLADAKWKGRIGMARPAFGTTRSHMGVLADAWGNQGLKTWLEALEANNLRLYDGNATVVRAVRLGEIDVGLTDTDDVWAGQRNGWEVDAIFEKQGIERLGLTSTGPVLLPNTVAMVAGGPNPDNAARLIDYLLSERVETLMARSDSRNIPVHPNLQERFKPLMVEGAAEIDYEAVAERIDDAMAICDQVLEGP